MAVTEIQVRRVVELLSGVDVRSAARFVDGEGVARWRLAYRTPSRDDGLGVIDEGLVTTVLTTMLSALEPAALKVAA